MNKVFLDTNVLISWVFIINSLHFKSEKVFEAYSEFFWSTFVKKEFDASYGDKLDCLLDFFRKLQKYLENPEKEFYSIGDLLKFAKENYSGELLRNIKSSIFPFWNEYLGFESQIFFLDMEKSIEYCLNDLSLNLESNKLKLEKLMQLSPIRKKNYHNLDAMLESYGVHDEDRIVTLDGHDFACFSSEPVDFVTFDDNCFNGANNLDVLCFNSIKGKYDFKAS